ncbi:hypothetical protein XENOCAPTIV_000213 [Xenoophorus captivus]|uniref:Uncharacterized protein n=1 Tax=Xenoophorus captivus TaxID=1517983 RepID=A0ABV0RT62_9TELE
MAPFNSDTELVLHASDSGKEASIKRAVIPFTAPVLQTWTHQCALHALQLCFVITTCGPSLQFAALLNPLSDQPSLDLDSKTQLGSVRYSSETRRREGAMVDAEGRKRGRFLKKLVVREI